MVHLIEISNGEVVQVITFLNTPGFSAMDAAENLAKTMSEANGILFQGNVSCDSNPGKYSIQIFESEV